MKKNILIVGASGYRNIGDEAYKAVFADYLGNEYNLFFDSPYPDTSYMDKIDYMVIGGGGLIYEYEENHLNYFSEYVKEARKRGIHYSLISCGVQSSEIYGWKEILDNADLITLRSKADVEIVKGITNHKLIYQFPDLAYLMKPCNYRVAGDIDLVVISKQDSHEDNFIRNAIREAKQEGKTIYLLAFSDDDLRAIEMLRPIISEHSNYRTRTNLTPYEACSILQHTKKVITSRYHGLILARAMGISEENIINTKQNYKLATDIRPYRMQDAEEHIELLRSFLEVKHERI